jgi:translation initiation factor 1
MSARTNKDSKLVYSTEQGRVGSSGNKPATASTGASQKSSRKSDGIVRISRQTKGRKGKGVCLITGLALAAGELEDLARQLKQRLGTGGAVKDGVIEIQGDHREQLALELQKMGYSVKLAGG